MYLEDKDIRRALAYAQQALDEARGQTVELTAPTALALANNTVYYVTEVSSLALSYPAAGHWECYISLATAASGTVTVTLPASRYIGAVPVFGNGETWELSIRDGVVIAAKSEVPA